MWNTKQLQSLKRLHFHQQYSINQNIHWLTRKCHIFGNGYEVHPSLLPELEILDIVDMPHKSQNVLEDLITLLKSRLPPIQNSANAADMDTDRSLSYLKSVSIGFQDQSNENFMRRFICSDMISYRMALNVGYLTVFLMKMMETLMRLDPKRVKRRKRVKAKRVKAKGVKAKGVKAKGVKAKRMKKRVMRMRAKMSMRRRNTEKVIQMTVIVIEDEVFSEE
ncbi:hypothetical protein BDQ17DRAFT_1325945 [Cyathus striatus]|nr:hypothetical protein BDQ17DRAFT_1325945 [Cyathus striatus]